MQSLSLKTRATTAWALLPCHKLLSPLTTLCRFLILVAHNPLRDAHPLHQARARHSRELRHIDSHRLRVAIEDGIEALARDCTKWVVKRKVVTMSQHLEHGKEHIIMILTQWLYATIAKREACIGYNLFYIEDRPITQTITLGASTLG